MTVGCTEEPDHPVHHERRRLIGLAYRILGTVSEAEDAVQEAYLRWYRLDEGERSGVASPAAWLTRVTSRICLDMLGSARARREQYVGQWLPEPVPAGLFAAGTAGAGGAGDPLDQVTLDESVSTALLVVLEAMTPAERVAFILHDVFALPFDEIADIVGRTPASTRQLATSARRRVRSEQTRPVDRADHARLVRAFQDASHRGDLDALTAVLDPTVRLRSDGGGVVKAALNPLTGAAKVARFLLGVLAKNAGVRLAPRATDDGPALVLLRGHDVSGVINLQSDGDHITRVWIQWNPHKLTQWSGGSLAPGPSDGSRQTGSPAPPQGPTDPAVSDPTHTRLV